MNTWMVVPKLWVRRASDHAIRGLDKLTGEGDKAEGEQTATGEDPEIIQARLEQEERRKEKHRKMEAEREKMRQDIRDKYGLKKKEDEQAAFMQDCEGRIGASRRKTPEELAAEGEEDDTILGQLGLNTAFDKAKTAVTDAAEKVKGFLPFGK